MRSKYTAGGVQYILYVVLAVETTTVLLATTTVRTEVRM